MDLKNILEQARGVQSKIAEVQRDLEHRSVEASAGGGMVTAVATGALKIREIKIEPALLETGDRAMLQDLVAAAVNAALGEAQKMAQQELQKAAGGPLAGLLGNDGPS